MFYLIVCLSLFLGACSSNTNKVNTPVYETGGVSIIESENMSEKDKFFKKQLFPELRKGNYVYAQQMLSSELEKHPEYAKEPLYYTAHGLISFNNGDYDMAYAEASRVINIMEQRFAPKKPYQIKFETEPARNSVAAHYLYRYQALMKLGRYSEALLDVENSLKISEKPRVFFIKACLHLLLNNYEEAAASMNKAYQLDNNFMSDINSDAAMNCCTILHEHGYKKVSACAEIFAQIEEKQKEAQED